MDHVALRPKRLSPLAEEIELWSKLYASLAAGKLDAVIDDSPIAMYFSQFVGGLQFAGVEDLKDYLLSLPDRLRVSPRFAILAGVCASGGTWERRANS